MPEQVCEVCTESGHVWCMPARSEAHIPLFIQAHDAVGLSGEEAEDS